MHVMPFPIITEVRLWQYAKVCISKRVTLSGIVISVMLLHPKKAAVSMLVTFSGIVIDVKSRQLENAHNPLLETSLGIIVFLHPRINLLVAVSIIALQLLRLSYLGLPDCTIMEVRLLQWKKAELPIFVILLGMNREVRL